MARFKHRSSIVEIKPFIGCVAVLFSTNKEEEEVQKINPSSTEVPSQRFLCDDDDAFVPGPSSSNNNKTFKISPKY